MVRSILAPLRDRLARITKHSSEEDFAELSDQLNSLSASSIAGILGRLKKRRRASVYRLIEKDLALEVFGSSAPTAQSDLLTALQEHDTAEIFLGLDPEDRVWLLDDLPATVASKLMQGLNDDERHETAALCRIIGIQIMQWGGVRVPSLSSCTPGLAGTRQCGACERTLLEPNPFIIYRS